MLKPLKNMAHKAMRSFGLDIHKALPIVVPAIRPEFGSISANAAMQKILDGCEFESVLDIGCGEGEHAEIFLRHGKQVTALDYGKSVYFEKNKHRMDCVVGDFNTMKFDRQFDCIWAAHVLEHQPNVGIFLRKVYEVAKEGAVVCITVPPYFPSVLGGHLTYWNGGLLLYNLVVAGFDCRCASILRYGYNISVIIRKRAITLPDLAFDFGDVDRIAIFLPEGLREGFDGDIVQHNWPI